MGQIVGEYLINNSSTLIQSVFFSFLGAFFGLLLTPKQTVSNMNNGTSVHNMQTILVRKTTINKVYSPKVQGDISPAILVFGCFVLLAFFYVKYHEYIMDYLLGFTIMGITSTFTVAIKLHLNNGYDKLNKLWTISLLFVWTINLVHLSIMTAQKDPTIAVSNLNTFLSTGGMNAVHKNITYVEGFLFLVMVNVIVIGMLINMFAVNRYRATGGKIAEFFFYKTKVFVMRPYLMVGLVFILSIVSMVFASGLIYQLITNTSNLAIN